MFKLYGEIIIHSITSPGTHLPNRDDLYVTIDAFNQVKRTNLVYSLFPLTFQKRFIFEKLFWSCPSPNEVVKAMEDIPVTVELRQVADIYLGGTLLAYFDTNARDFFYPCNSLCPRSVHNREMLMIRTVDFPGISPKVDFSSYCTIQKTGKQPQNSPKGDASDCKSCHNSKRGVDRTLYAAQEASYGLHTVNSALRSRSPSPQHRQQAKKHVISDLVNHQIRRRAFSSSGARANLIDDRDPFVVRHPEEKTLGRKPKFHQSPLMCHHNNNAMTAGGGSPSSQYHRRCHSRCHSSLKLAAPLSIGDKLESAKSIKSIHKTVRSLSRPSSPIYYSHLSTTQHEHNRYR